MRRALREAMARDGRASVDPKRSNAMSAIRARGNRTTEWRLRGGLIRGGVRGWVLHPRTLTGRPDFWFPSSRLAVFVDGCYWHGCRVCRRDIKTNPQFWNTKIALNRFRDSQVTRSLRKDSILVIRYWEHELRNDLALCVKRIADLLNNSSRSKVSEVKEMSRG